VASVASPLEVPKPTVFHVAYLNLMKVSGVLGLASVVESLRVWRGFLLEIVTLYQEVDQASTLQGANGLLASGVARAANDGSQGPDPFPADPSHPPYKRQERERQSPETLFCSRPGD